MPENIPLSEEGVELTHALEAPAEKESPPEAPEEAPKPEQTIDLEKELGEDIHLPSSTQTAAPRPAPSLADALKAVQTEAKPGEGRPFVALTPLREIPHVPSAAAPKSLAASAPTTAATPASLPPKPAAAAEPSGIARMHPEVAPTVAAPAAVPHHAMPERVPTPPAQDATPVNPRDLSVSTAAALFKSLEAPSAPAAAIAPPKPAPQPAAVAPTPETAPSTPKASVVPVAKGPAIVGGPKARLSVLEQLREQSSSPLHPLRTYKSDAQMSVQSNRTSLVTMAAAEETRRARVSSTAAATPQPRAPISWARITIWTLTALFIVGGCAAAIYVYIGPPTVDPETTVQASNILYIDESVEVPLSGLDHLALVTELAKLRDSTTLSLGLMRETYFTLPTEAGGKRLASTQEVAPRLAPNMPPSLLRALQPEFILGTHVFDRNQGFIVFKTDNYQQAFSGMVEWEHAMRGDLLPFMDRRPRERLPNEGTNSTTTPRVIASSFVDRVVRNHDARVLYNDAGDIVLLYSFLDQRTIAITTNEHTLFEIASRLRDVRF